MHGILCFMACRTRHFLLLFHSCGISENKTGQHRSMVMGSRLKATGDFDIQYHIAAIVLYYCICVIILLQTIFLDCLQPVTCHEHPDVVPHVKHTKHTPAGCIILPHCEQAGACSMIRCDDMDRISAPRASRAVCDAADMLPDMGSSSCN